MHTVIQNVFIRNVSLRFYAKSTFCVCFEVHIPVPYTCTNVCLILTTSAIVKIDLNFKQISVQLVTSYYLLILRYLCIFKIFVHFLFAVFPRLSKRYTIIFLALMPDNNRNYRKIYAMCTLILLAMRVGGGGGGGAQMPG